MNNIENNLFAEHHTHRHTLRKAIVLSVIVVLILLAAGSLRYISNIRDAQALEQQTQRNLIRTVNIAHAKADKLQNTLVLPASLRGYSESTLYARSNGYISAWYKNIGDNVQRGDLLAKIEAPEQTQELAQAQATREQVRTRLALAKSTQERWEILRQHDSVPQQELEEKRSNYQQTQAELAVIDANIQRLQQLESFRRVTAPFTGVVTQRSVDIGDLISANGKALFALAQTDKLRLSLGIPQIYAGEIKVSQEVNISISGVREKFQGKIEHIAGAIDPATRARQIEVVLDNIEHKLIPGAYAEVSIHLTKPVPAQMIPASALLIKQDEPYVVVVNKQHKIEFHPIKIGRDLGKTIEVIAGVSHDDALVLSPSELLEAGEKVNPKLIVLKDSENKDKDSKDKKEDKNPDAANTRGKV